MKRPYFYSLLKRGQMKNQGDYKDNLSVLKKLKDHTHPHFSPSNELTIEEMGKRIAKSKKPKIHSFSNPINGNSLY
jgi:hypothetical protein